MPMTEGPQVRQARPDDSAACAAILNEWIDRTGWMPRVRSRGEIRRHYRNRVFRKRQVFVIGDPAEAHVILSADSFVTSLYSAEPGKGRGKALLDHVKGPRPQLSLWTFVANTGARRFYEREGFVELRRTDGENQENLPDILYARGEG